MKGCLGLVVLIALASAPAVRAGESTPCDFQPNLPVCVTGTGVGGGFGAGVSDANNGDTGSGDAANGGRPVGLKGTYTVYDYAPTCTGNTRTGAGSLCGSAVDSCATAGAGFINYWRWKATVSRATGEVLDPPGWVQSPGSYCLGPSEAGLPPVAVIGGILADEFKNLLVIKGTVTVEPSGTTLVNYETGFSTGAARYVLNPVQILGRSVTVTAIPQSYDWYFGDGTSQLSGGPGRRGTLDVSHSYRDKGRVAPYVVITWRGTFTVDGGPPQDVIGTAQTTSPTTPLQVKQARAELVSR